MFTEIRNKILNGISSKIISYSIIVFLFLGISHDLYHDHSDHKTKTSSQCCDHSHTKNTEQEKSDQQSEETCPIYIFLSLLKSVDFFSVTLELKFLLISQILVISFLSKALKTFQKSFFNRGPPAFSLI